ncbi:hypothetical protein Tco_0373639 [Tanacetum coccineum]
MVNNKAVCYLSRLPSPHAESKPRSRVDEYFWTRTKPPLKLILLKQHHGPSFTAQTNRPQRRSSGRLQSQLKYDRIEKSPTTAIKQFLDSIDEGMKKIIKEQVKKEVSKITPKIEKLVTDQLESEVLVRSSKKDTYGDTVTIKRPRDGADDDQEPSAGTDQGSKRRRSGKEPASTSAPSPTFELMKGTCKSLTELEYFCEEVYKATTEKLDWINPEGRQYPHDLRQPLPLVPNLSQGQSCYTRFITSSNTTLSTYVVVVQAASTLLHYKTTGSRLRHIKWIEDLVPNSMWSQMIVKYDKFALWGISHWGKKRRQFYAFATSRESARDVYSKRRIIAVTKVEIVEWQDYKHLDWITVRRDDDVLYKFKEGDFHRLRIQDIEDMLLLLVQGKVTNLNVEERIAFNVSLRMFTRSVVIQRRVEDLQLGVESYQKKLNLTKPDTYRSNLRRQANIHHTPIQEDSSTRTKTRRTD